MCRRYRIEKDVLDRFVDIPGYHPGFPEEVVENALAPALILKDNRYSLIALTFGFDIVEKKVLNARLETVDQKDFFLSSFEKRRCVLVASSFFEVDNSGIEREFRTGGTIYLAGIHKNGEFVILTTKPDETVSFYHKRMPLVLLRDHVKDYLSGRLDKEALLKIQKPSLRVVGGNDQLTLF